MTQFDSYNPTKNALDDAVRSTRAKPQPAAVLNMRKTPRMSIDELNATDVDTLREKFLTARRDDRGPVESFLDLLDAPRNVILSTLNPGLERKSREAGNTGAFGVGRVGAADVLGEMGLQPGVLRGVLGFIGDVAFDPLTYLGPPGWGAKVGTAGGRAARFGAGAARALEKGVDPTVQALKAVAGTAPLKEAVLGGAKAGGNTFTRAKRFAGKVLGGDVEHEGGLVAKYLDDPITHTDLPEVAAAKKAVADFYAKYAAGAGPGVRIGKNSAGKLGVEVARRGEGKIVGSTSAIGHIPFTDIGLYVPGFTNAGIAQGATIGTAKLIGQGPVDAETTQRLNDVRTAVADAQGSHKAITDLIARRRKFYAQNAAELEKIKAMPGQRPRNAAELFPGAQAPDAEHPLLVAEAALNGEQEALFAKLREQRLHINDIRQKAETQGVRNPLAALLLRKEIKAYEAMVGDAAAKWEGLDSGIRAWAGVKSDEAKHLNQSLGTIRELAEMDQSVKKGGPLVRMNQTEVGMAPELANDFIPPPEVDPMGRVERNRRLREIETERLSLDPYNETHNLRFQELDLEEQLINSADRLANKTVGMAAGEGKDKIHRPFLGDDPLRPGESIVHGSLDEVGAHLPGIRQPLDDYKAARDDLVKAENYGGPLPEQEAAGETMGTLRQKAEDARNRLYEATAPLRDKTRLPQSTAELEESIRAADRATLDNDLRTLVDNVPEHEIQSRQAERKLEAEMMTHSLMASIATHGSALDFLNDEQHRALQLTKLMLGTTDDLVGANAMAAPANILAAIFAPKAENILDTRMRLEAVLRHMYGGNTGMVQDAIRRGGYMKNDGAQRAVKQMVSDMRVQLRELAAKHQVEGQESDLLALISALDYKARDLKTLRTHDAKGNLVGVMAMLDNVAQNGLLNETLHPGLRADLEALTAKWGAQFQDPMTEAELAAGVLPESKRLKSYSAGGHQVTQTGQDFIRTAIKSSPDSGTLRNARQAGMERFLKERVSGSAVFPSATAGKDVEVFEADRWMQTFTDEQIEAMSDKVLAKDIQEKRDLLNEYDAHPNRAAYPMLENDPVRLNALIQGTTDTPGRFQTLFGASKAPGGLFDQNYLTSMASRLLQHETAMANKGFDAVRENAGLLVDLGLLKKNVNNVGDVIELENGTKGRIVKIGKNKNGIQIGDDVFRALDESVRTSDSPIVKLMGKNNLGHVYHTRVAEAIEAAEAVHKNEDFWKWLDRATSIWKSTTLLHPAYAIGNFIGDSMNAAIRNPAYIKDAFRFGKAAMQAVWDGKSPERMAALKINVNGTETSMKEFLDMLKGDRLFGANLWSESPLAVSRYNTILDSRMGTATESMRVSAIKKDLDQLTEEAKAQGLGSIGANTNAAYALANDRTKRWVMEPWHRINEKAQDWTRLINYLSYRDQGFDHAAAVNRVVESMFDYHQMTQFERSTMRRLLPFYSWLKNNGMYQAKMLMERPIYVGALPVFQRALEEAINGDEVIPMNRRPQWMREALAIQLGTNPDTRTAITAGTWLPQEQGVLLGKAATGGLAGAQSAMKDLVSGVNPFIRTFGEIATGRQVFSGKSIGPTTDTADISIPDAILSQIRPLREAQKIVRTGQETGIGGAAARALVGGRTQPFTDKRIQTSVAREFADEEAKLRNAIRTAEFKDDHATSLRLRVKLLKLYEAKKRAGQKVPKWSEKYLQATQK